jgi:predicted ATPase
VVINHSLCSHLPFAGEETKQKFQWLSTIPVQSHHAKANQDLVADTGLWLMKGQHYIDWKQSTKSCAFLLHGSLGCGKTALMSVCAVLEWYRTWANVE